MRVRSVAFGALALVPIFVSTSASFAQQQSQPAAIALTVIPALGAAGISNPAAATILPPGTAKDTTAGTSRIATGMPRALLSSDKLDGTMLREMKLQAPSATRTAEP